jgi:hypothetical protein
VVFPTRAELPSLAIGYDHWSTCMLAPQVVIVAEAVS